MAEIQHVKIKGIYGDLNGLLAQIPQVTDRSHVNGFITRQFNDLVDQLSEVANTDYSSSKIPTYLRIRSDRSVHGLYDATVVRSQIGRLIGRLEEEYSFGKDKVSESPNIAIFNKNQNEVSIQIDYTFNDIIEEIDDEEGKNKIGELRDELKKDDRDWEKIKGILVWILNFSKAVFLKVLPIILQAKL